MGSDRIFFLGRYFKTEFLLFFSLIVLISAFPYPQDINPKTGQPTGWLGFFSTIDFLNSNSHDLTNGACKQVLLLIARGSGEPGNIGVTIGPALCGGLRKRYGNNFGCQGIDPNGYSAAILDNFKPKGTSDTSIEAGVKDFNRVHEKCPNSLLLFEGYSQGAALMHNVIPALSEAVRKQIVAGVLFGDTKNQQNNSTITGFPKENILSLCVKDDGVCWGGFSITAGHVVYTQNGDVEKAITFLASRVDNALKSKQSLS